jgi:hypothetical protein
MPNKQVLTPEGEMYVPDPSKPKAVMVDLDGTIAKMINRTPFEWDRVGEDEPVKNVIDVVKAMAIAGFKVIFVSGRDGSCALQTGMWVDTHYDGPYENIFMREPKDNRKDNIVKLEIFDKYIRDNYNVVAVFDDRDQVVRMWRSIGLTCMQVEYGDF